MEDEAQQVAAEIEADIRSLTDRNTSTMRAIRRKYSHSLQTESVEFVFELAMILSKIDGYRWIAYELIRGHPAAFASLGPAELERLGRGINSWWTVDAFARTLSGPAWLKGKVADQIILKWARSSDRWWRRAALVSTVAWNVRSLDGRGDAPRTLAVCRLLAGEHDDMLAKALSWALRMLAFFDPAAVRSFLEDYDAVLAARVKREVRIKLATGLKNPRRKRNVE